MTSTTKPLYGVLWPFCFLNIFCVDWILILWQEAESAVSGPSDEHVRLVCFYFVSDSVACRARRQIVITLRCSISLKTKNTQNKLGPDNSRQIWLWNQHFCFIIRLRNIKRPAWHVSVMCLVPGECNVLMMSSISASSREQEREVVRL